MTDFDDLKSALGAAAPRPDAQRRAENLALAQKNFETLQGSTDAARPTSITGPKGLWTGVKTMLNSLTSRGAITASTALVAVGFLFVSPLGQDWMRVPKPAPQPQPTLEEALAAAPGSFTTPIEEVDEATIKRDDSNHFDTPVAAGRVIEPAVELGAGLTEQSMQIPANPAMTTQKASPSADGVTFGAMAAFEDNNTEIALPAQAEFGSETYANAAPNPLKITTEDPVSTFSIDVDTASYSLVRSSLMRGNLPPPDAIRVEELINYFPYNYPAPDADAAPFRPTVGVMQTPWNPGTQLVHIAIQGQMPAIDDRPPLNLVFLIDTSGSMDDPTKLPLLKQSFRLMLDQLRPADEVAIVEYAGSAGQVLTPTVASDRSTILRAINGLGAGGATNGQGGLEQAYAVAATMAEEGEVGRVILATDGDFNVGIDSPDALKDYISDKRDSGTYLSVLGFGRGNLDDATMQALAQNGNGQAAYIDTLSEAQKVLVDQLTGALFPIAGDVKVQVEFNPSEIAEYRLIGYETRALRREDFNNDAVDAGELGAGHSVTAIYEVTPIGSPAQLSDPLRYADAELTTQTGELGYLKLRYKSPGEDRSQLIATPISVDLTATSEARFASAIAGFGQLLRRSNYLGDWGYDQAIKLANANKGEDAFGYRTEAVQLMRLAQSLSN